MPLCPFFPEQPAGELKCDYLVAKDPSYRNDYIKEFCKGRFKDCTYYFHLSKWLERINEALNADEEDEES